jgi:hypothetical protein
MFIVTGDANGSIGASAGATCWSKTADTGRACSFSKACPPEQVCWSRPLITSVAKVQNPTTIVMNARAGQTISGTTQWDIGTDNTVPLKRCLKRGNCTMPLAGTNSYLFNAGNIRIPSNTALLCQPGVSLFWAHHDDYSGYTDLYGRATLLELYNAANATITGCMFQGTDIHNTYISVPEDGNYVIVLSGRGTVNDTISHNSFRDNWSNADIDITGSIQYTGLPNGNTISRNTIGPCGFNGLAIIAGTSNVISNNTFADCFLDVEPNSTDNGPVNDNLLADNTFRQTGIRPGYASSYMVNGNNYLVDQYGEHWATGLSSCSVSQCDSSGASTISVTGNKFFGEIQLSPHCMHRGSGGIGQSWTSNIAHLPSGATCSPGLGVSPPAGCAYYLSFMCWP